MEIVPAPESKTPLVLEHVTNVTDNQNVGETLHFFKIKKNTFCLLQKIKYPAENVNLNISIYNPSDRNFSNNLIKTGVGILRNKEIQKYARVAHQKEDLYTFYIVIKKQKKNIIGKDDVLYSVQKMNCISDNQDCTIEYMFSHNSSIVHMTVVNYNDTDYLVVGSTYPSIKIYDLRKNQVVATLHNRFLLGCIDNTVFYAKMNDRPSWGLTRWYNNRQKNVNNIPCRMYFLSDLLDKNKEQLLYDNENNVSINIKRTEPPVINEYDDSIIFTNQFKTYTISKNTAKQNFFTIKSIDNAFIYASPLKYAEALTYFLKNNNELIFKDISLKITLDNFKKFINVKHEDLKKSLSNASNPLHVDLNIFMLRGFIEFLIQSYFEENTFINHQYIKRIAALVAGKLNTDIIKKEQSFDFNNNKDFISIKNKIETFFNNNFKNIEIGDFNSSLYVSYLNNNNTINETIPNQQIAQNNDYILLLSGPKIGIIDKKTNQQTICLLKDFDAIKDVVEKNSHLFVFDNKFYLIINNNLYSLMPTLIQKEKSSQIMQEEQDAINIDNLIKELTEIKEEVSKSKRLLQHSRSVDKKEQAAEIPQPKKLLDRTDPQENVAQKGLITVDQASSIAQSIYNHIIKDEFIASIKNLIEKQTRFIVNENQYNTIRKDATRLAEFLSVVAIKYYITPIINIIINDNIDSILQNTNVNLDNKKDLIKNFLVTTLQDQNIWLTHLIDEADLFSKKISNSYSSINTEQIQKRFENVDDAALNDDRNLKGLQYLYFAENNKITFTKDESGFFSNTEKTLINNDTIFNYLKGLFLENVQNIKSYLTKNKKEFDNRLITILQR